jgi:hypothetical protein
MRMILSIIFIVGIFSAPIWIPLVEPKTSKPNKTEKDNKSTINREKYKRPTNTQYGINNLVKLFNKQITIAETNIYTKPTINSTVAGYFPAYTKVEIKSVSQSWASVEVSIDNSPTMTGYIEKKYLELDNGRMNSYSYSNTYDYTVSGDGVYGDVFMDDEEGSGTLYDDDGNELDVDVYWTGYGELEAIDQNGDNYILEVE